MDYKEILLKGIRIGVILILFTPLVLGPFGLSLSNYPKTVFFRTLVEIIFILYLILLFLDSQYLPKISPLVLVISLFVGILFLSSLTGVNFHLSFFGELHRAEGVILHLHFLIFFLILISIFKEKKDWFLFFKLAVIVSALSSFAGILQKLGIARFYGLDLPSRISGTWTNPDFFAPYIVLAIFLGIFILAAEKKKNWKIIWAFILALNFFTLILSGTRTSWVGTTAGLIFLFLFWFFGFAKLNQKKRKIILLGILALTIFLLLIILNQDRLSLDKNVLFQRAMSILDPRSYLASSRRPVWQIAIEAWRERPIFGWGPESFSYLFDKYFKASYIPVLSEKLYFDRPHNKVLELMATTGILGILSYLSIFFTAFYLLFKSKSKSPIFSLILISLFLSHFVQNLSVFDTIGTYLISFLVFGFINNNFPSSNFKPIRNQRFLNRIKFLLIPLLIILSLIAFYQLNFKPTKASLAFVRGVGLEKQDYKRALLEYEKGISQNTVYDKEFRKELIGRLIFVLENFRISKEAEAETVKILSDLKQFSEKELEKPDKRYLENYELLARINERIYLFSGDLEAVKAMEEVSWQALNFNDQKPEFYRLIGRAKILQKNYSEGEAFFQKALELSLTGMELPGFGNQIQFYKGLAIAYLKAGDKPKAAENFKEALKREFSLRKFEEPSSESVQQTLTFAISLARIYYQEFNDATTARQIYQRAMEVFPTHREQLQSNLEKLIQ